ncbi:hypothetical protein B0H13DRAFT_2672725 [Mycena leptocephala]|nr:hypothetical protein B0H13DRAFT_2672725 [Mycena leptocephala]
MKVTTDGHATLDDDDRLGLSAPDVGRPPTYDNCLIYDSFRKCSIFFFSLFFDISKQTEQTTILLDTDNTSTMTSAYIIEPGTKPTVLYPTFVTLLDVAPCLMWILPPTSLLPLRRSSSPTAAATNTSTRHPVLPPLSLLDTLPLLLNPTLFTLLDSVLITTFLISLRRSSSPAAATPTRNLVLPSALPHCLFVVPVPCCFVRKIPSVFTCLMYPCLIRLITRPPSFHPPPVLLPRRGCSEYPDAKPRPPFGSALTVFTRYDCCLVRKTPPVFTCLNDLA